MPANPELTAPRLMRDVDALCAPALAGRGSFQPGGAAAARYVERELAAAGLDVIVQRVPTHLGAGAVNVVGVKRAGPRAVIVSAHYDHLGVGTGGQVHLGADDNASGVAVLLAMARAAQRRQFEHTVLFIAFGAEEAGLVGSGIYVREPLWPLEQTLALINFDMVGRNFFELGADRPAAVAAVGLDEVDGARRAAEAAADRVGLAIVASPPRLLELFGYDDRTDDWWFRRQQIPSIHFSTGLHADYHRITDTPDRLVPEQMERVARTAFAVLEQVAEKR